MKCEIEFLAVGANSKPGDAIIVRYGEPDAYELMVVDGGHAETGESLVSHLRKHFGRDASLAHVVLTHSDGDHASGLRDVLREIPVQNLWLHIPWFLAEEARHLFKDKRWTQEGLRAAIKKEYDIISEIVDLAVAAGCKIHYPFRGSIIGPFYVLSPSRPAYLHLLPQFDKTPEPDQDLIENASMWVGKAEASSPFAGLFEKLVTKAVTWIDDKWGIEQLRDGGVTSASNESSVVLYGDFGDHRRVLLTGDAGIKGLTWAADCAELYGLPLQQFSFVQIPHHGSRRNVGPTILNRLLGGIQPEGSNTRFTTFVSAPADDETHPRKIVLNAFMRRGGKVIATQGTNKIHYGGFPKRDGYVDATPISFSSKVEVYD
jgi:beta-lactamase superfamily II metal-dependent hydrolase